jgi:hypothetical protein
MIYLIYQKEREVKTMDKEKLIKQIMEECEANGEPVTKEEAAEMAEMELKNKSNGRRYEGDTKSKKPANRTLKVDTEKVEIIKVIAEMLIADEIKIINPQHEIQIKIGNNDYSITLTKHRKK